MKMFVSTPIEKTIGAYRFDKGIAMGIHNMDNFISLEYNAEKNRVELLINEELMAKQGITIVKVNDDWGEV